jgi:hypothetical protein
MAGIHPASVCDARSTELAGLAASDFDELSRASALAAAPFAVLRLALPARSNYDRFDAS